MLYLVVYILNLYDLLISHYVINVWQVAAEGNLLMAPIIDSWTVVFIKVVVMAAVMYLLWKKRHYRVARAGGKFLLVLYSLVVVNNTLVAFGIL